MLTKLSHPGGERYQLYLDLEDIILIERYNKPTTTLILDDDKPSMTSLALKSGRTVSCLETPEEILRLKMLDKLAS